MAGELKLFLGLPLDPTFEWEMRKSNPYLVSMLTTTGPYLQKIEINNKKYLGKFLSPTPHLSEIDLLEVHILSLLRKIAPHYLFATNPPVLIPHMIHGA